MALLINIDDLVHAKTVEYTRIEFKESWNPEAVLHTVCAFANDYHEYGGGYLVIGIEEDEGRPILPPKGLNADQIDSYQKKFFEICKKISPEVLPIIEPVEFQEKLVLVIWVVTGEARPYDAPESLGKNSQRRIYVRSGSVTSIASKATITALLELSKFRHLDDRANQQATLADLDKDLIASYLQDTKSSLFEEGAKMPIDELCALMQICRGPKENVRPLNVGLLLFCKKPERFFEGFFTNLVEFDDEAGTSYSEKQFTGPIQIQIRDLMDYIQTNIIKTFTKKDTRTAESISFSNYPYLAIREAVVNALYHRLLDHPNPNEIKIYKRSDGSGADTRRIEILSYPGPLPPVDENALASLQIKARNYRNIRLGEWLKGLRLVEKYGTGVPTMIKALKENGSPLPLLSTNPEKDYFLVVFGVHPDTPETDSSSASEIDTVSLTDIQQSILELLAMEPLSKTKLIGAFEDDISTDIIFLTDSGFLKTSKIGSATVYFVTSEGLKALKTSF